MIVPLLGGLVAASALAATPVPNTRLCVDPPANARWNEKNLAFEAGPTVLTVLEQPPAPLDAVMMAGVWTKNGFTPGPVEELKVGAFTGWRMPLRGTDGGRPLEGYSSFLSDGVVGVQLIAVHVGANPKPPALKALIESVTVCGAPREASWTVTPTGGLTEARRDANSGEWRAADGAELRMFLLPSQGVPGFLAEMVPGNPLLGEEFRLRAVGAVRAWEGYQVMDLDAGDVVGFLAWRPHGDRTAVFVAVSTPASWPRHRAAAEATLATWTAKP